MSLVHNSRSLSLNPSPIQRSAFVSLPHIRNMSLANPALQPTKLIDEVGYEIRSHGTGAKDPKLAGMSLIEQFDYLISLSHEQESSEGQHKVAEEESSEGQHKVEEEESSEGQHKVEEEESSEEQHKGGEGGGGGGGEEEEDEDEDEDEDEGGGEEEFGVCEVCLKDNEHDTFDCPYLDRIPNLEATIGDGCAIVCRECHALGGHPNWSWVGRAIMKFCSFCQRRGVHWDSECPKNPNPKVYVASKRKTLKWEVYGGI